MDNTLTQLMQLARPRRQLTGEDAAAALTASRLQAIASLFLRTTRILVIVRWREAECLVCGSVALAVGRRYLGACGRQS